MFLPTCRTVRGVEGMKRDHALAEGTERKEWPAGENHVPDVARGSVKVSIPKGLWGL